MNIVFVGCGFVFDIYMRTVQAHGELQILGVFDINSDRMRRVTAHYGFETYDSYEDVLADPSVEAIINLTPISAHFEVSKRALQAGKHVFSEKPLTKNLAQSQEPFEIAEANGKRQTANGKRQTASGFMRHLQIFLPIASARFFARSNKGRLANLC